MPRRQPDHDRDERVSLHGPDPEEVLRALLKVDPDDEPAVTDDEPEDRVKGR